MRSAAVLGEQSLASRVVDLVVLRELHLRAELGQRHRRLLVELARDFAVIAEVVEALLHARRALDGVELAELQLVALRRVALYGEPPASLAWQDADRDHAVVVGLALDRARVGLA